MVMLVLVIGALIGTTVMYLAETERAALSLTHRRAASRALAWSGVQAAMAELWAQRQELLRGGSPRLTTEAVLFRVGPRAGLFRLVGDPRAEAAGLDLNTASAERIAALLGLGASAGERVVALRPLGSIDDAAGSDADVGSALARRGADVSVFVFDPALRAGAGAQEDGEPGAPRADLNGPGRDAALELVLGPEAGAAVGRIADRDGGIRGDAGLVRALREAAVPVERWGEAMDSFTDGPGAYRQGAVDLMRASVRVLGTVPGIERAAAERIVSLRADVTGRAAASPAWLVTEGVLSPDAFQEAAPHLVVRSLQWRVVVEGGTASIGEDAAWENGPLEDRVVLEAVIDVAGERARVAYLRDVSHLAAAEAMLRSPALFAGSIGAGSDGSTPEAPGEDLDTAGDTTEPPVPPGRPATGMLGMPEPDDVGTQARRGAYGDPRLGRWRIPPANPGEHAR